MLTSFSSYVPRRLHLDSSSHRSLVRILSHCLDHSLVYSSPSSDKTLSAKDHTTSHGSDSLIDGDTLAKDQENSLIDDDGLFVGVSPVCDLLADFDFNDLDEMEIEGRVKSEDLSNAMLECARIIDANKEELTGNEKIVIYGAIDGASHFEGASEVSNGEGRDSLFLNESENSKKIDGIVDELDSNVLVDCISYEKFSLGEAQEGDFKELEEKGEGARHEDFFSVSLMAVSGLRDLKEVEVHDLVYEIVEAEVEEGEISDDVQDLEGLVDSNDDEKLLEDQKKLEIKNVSKPGNNLSDTAEEDPFVIENQAKHKVSKRCSTMEVMGAKEMKKKKTGHLTEERKAKKKIAKKRKRAQKNREQGVKKLRIHAIIKPKEVKYCNFYLMGRCQQGNTCKFSHDTIPMTKSMPCKHFASNSCLKGSDCPYDHELSKYPCYNYTSTGSCNRGDRCKFSHKIPTTDGPSQLAVSKVDLHSISEQIKLSNQLVGTHTSLPDKGLFGTTNKGTPPLKHNLLKKTNQVPKGVRLLSFGRPHADLTKNVKESAYNYQKQNNVLLNGQQNLSTLSWNSPPLKKSMLLTEFVCSTSNSFTPKNSGNVAKGSSITYDGTDNFEGLEASKILDEFLFCDAG